MSASTILNLFACGVFRDDELVETYEDLCERIVLHNDVIEPEDEKIFEQFIQRVSDIKKTETLDLKMQPSTSKNSDLDCVKLVTVLIENTISTTKNLSSRKEFKMDFVIGGLAAVGSGFFTNPLELVKTRMQIQGELAARGQYSVQYKNFFNAGLVIAKHDGILALQAGLVPAQWFQFILNGIRLGLFQKLTDRGFTKNKNGEIVLHKTILLGGVCGVLGAVVGSPLYLIKTHLQTQAAQKISFGHQHNHDGTLSAFRKIYTEQGIKGLFRGTCSAIPRNFVGSTSQLTSFDYCKRWLNQYPLYRSSPLLTTFSASFIGGFVATVFITPFDLVSTRLYNQGVDKNGKGLLYKNYADCVLKICKSEGVYGLYKGFWAGYLRLGPHTVLSLVFWDQLKNVHKSYQFRAHPKTHINFV
ncbi:hypothetical protein RN001_012805 [Aquatica leii]|uniref:Solute carrier family 25 member 35 n=1 Tax=Aquatica leii TaxID=1421715 RepID=A0AAN7P5V3_9COLE|nr:hypothetical protein RN001_012805 [Aquatica leii]